MKHLPKNEYPDYYVDYIELVTEENIIEGLLHQKNEMITFFKSIPYTKHDYSYSHGKWTIKDILLHLIDAERIYAYRALRFARNDKTILSTFEENDYVGQAQANLRSLNDLLEEYIQVRTATISLFKQFSTKQLIQIGFVSNMSISVRAIGYIIQAHELHHKQIIQERYL